MVQKNSIMKKIYCAILILFCLPLCQMMGQDKLIKEFKEGFNISRLYGNEILIEIQSENFNNYEFHERCKKYELGNSINMDWLFASVFTKQKIEMLTEKKVSIAVYLNINLEGKVLNFMIRIVRADLVDSEKDMSNISWNEVKKINSLLKGLEYEVLRTNCPNSRHIYKEYVCYLKNLIKYKE